MWQIRLPDGRRLTADYEPFSLAWGATRSFSNRPWSKQDWADGTQVWAELYEANPGLNKYKRTGRYVMGNDTLIYVGVK